MRSIQVRPMFRLTNTQDMQAQPTNAPAAPAKVDGVDRTADMTPGQSAIYEALTNQREVLGDQLNQLENHRGELNRELQNGRVQGASKVGIENRIMNIDKRIADLEKQISGVDAQIATTAAVPGAVIVRHENMNNNGPPEEAFVLGALFMVIVLLPMSLAMARRIWKRTGTVASSIPADLMARLGRIEQAVDTSAVEIERIGEGQRFVTKLFSEQKAPALPPHNDRVS